MIWNNILYWFLIIYRKASSVNLFSRQKLSHICSTQKFYKKTKQNGFSLAVLLPYNCQRWEYNTFLQCSSIIITQCSSIIITAKNRAYGFLHMLCDHLTFLIIVQPFYSASENWSFPTPHNGHSKSSGTSSHFVPGAIPPSGYPSASSYSHQQTSHTYFMINSSSCLYSSI